MSPTLILASGSITRQTLLKNAGVQFETQIPRIDEEMIRLAMLEEDASPRDIADALAEMKAQKISSKFGNRLTLGCDQVLSFDGKVLTKPENQEMALHQLREMNGKPHMLLSAAVIYEFGKPVWRHVGTVRMSMRRLSENYLQNYVARNWESIQHSVGSYKLEEEGVRLFSQVNGDYFTVLGLPLLEILSYLSLRGEIES